MVRIVYKKNVICEIGQYNYFFGVFFPHCVICFLPGSYIVGMLYGGAGFNTFIIIL